MKCLHAVFGHSKEVHPYCDLTPKRKTEVLKAFEKKPVLFINLFDDCKSLLKKAIDDNNEASHIKILFDALNLLDDKFKEDLTGLRQALLEHILRKMNSEAGRIPERSWNIFEAVLVQCSEPEIKLICKKWFNIDPEDKEAIKR